MSLPANPNQLPEFVRGYTITLQNQQLGSAPIDLVSLYPNPNLPYKLMLLGVYVFNVDGITVAGEAGEFYGRWEIIRGHTTPSANGTPYTPIPTDDDEEPANFTAAVLSTTLAANGVPKVLHSDGLGSRQGIIYPAVKFARLRCGPASSSLVIRLPAALSLQMRCNVTVYVAEYSHKRLRVMELT